MTTAQPNKTGTIVAIRSKGPRFGLKLLLGVTTGLCGLFAILSASGASTWQALVGFVVIGTGSALFALIAEAWNVVTGDRRSTL